MKRLSVVLALLALLVPAGPANAADTVKIVYAFFQDPVEIPGGKVLPPGNYAFKMVDESGPAKVVQVMLALAYGTVGTPSAFNANKPMPVVATLVTVPDYLKTPVRAPATYWPGR